MSKPEFTAAHSIGPIRVQRPVVPQDTEPSSDTSDQAQTPEVASQGQEEGTKRLSLAEAELVWWRCRNTLMEHGFVIEKYRVIKDSNSPRWRKAEQRDSRSSEV